MSRTILPARRVFRQSERECREVQYRCTRQAIFSKKSVPLGMEKLPGMEKLQIAFDGKRAVRNSTGLGNYSRYAIEALSAAYPDHDYAVMSPGGDASRLASILERPDVCLVEPTKAIDRRFGALWRTFDITGQLADMGVDIYHGLSNELPLNIRRIPSLASVVTIHDLIWRRCPKDYKALDRAIYDYKYRHSAQNATRIIAISRCTRDDLVNDYGIDPAKIDIIYQGVDASFVPAGEYARIDIRRRYNLPERYIIGVGTIQPRKNQLLTLQALAALDSDIHLILIGRRTPYARDIDRYAATHGLQGRLHILEGVPFADLPALYGAATCAAYPSRYEGFGLPIVEALSCGTPVVAATGSCLEEAGGPGAVYIDPDDAEAMADALARICGDSRLRQSLADSGLRYVRRFSAENFARQTMETYLKALDAVRQS